MKNIYEYTSPTKEERFTTLLSHKNVKINHIVSSDLVTPILYKQKEDEWLVIIEGEALLEMKDKKISLLKGDTLFIPSNTPHRIVKTKKNTVWITVHVF